MRTWSRSRRTARTAGFTLIELVVVILILGIALGLFLSRSYTSSFWSQQSMIRRLVETIVFLHTQAVTDQSYYRIEFDFEKNQYQVGLMKPEPEDDERFQSIAADAGNLSLELAAFLNPSIGSVQTMIPPPDFPSLADPVPLEPGTELTEIRTMRGVKKKDEGGISYVLFSPRGFSEFAVIHLKLLAGKEITIFVNPFTGLAEVLDGYKDFKWIYGRKKEE